MKLSEGFQLLATAPDGVARLRKLILSLAVRGELISRNVCDEPPCQLLQQIRSEREQLIETGQIKAGRPPSPLTNDEKPFDLPSGWQWATLGSLSLHITDGTHHTPKYLPTGVPFISIKDIDGRTISFEDCKFISEEEHELINRRCNPERGDLLICRIGTLGRPTIVDTDVPFSVFVSVGLVKLPKCIDISAYLHLALRSPVLAAQYEQIKAGGSHTQKLNLGDIPQLLIPLPPIEEQARIVAKVHELMRLCDELEARGRLEAEQHARLTAALFDALTTSESSHALAENWARVAAHFDVLLDRPEAVDALEQIIVHLAVRGLLVQQDKDDKLATELLQKIRQEKDRLIADGTIRRDKPLQQLQENNLPYEAPTGWVWTRFGAVILDSEAGWSPSCENVSRASGQWGVLKVSAVSWGQFRPEENKELPAGLIPKPEYEVVSGDFLLSRANTDELVARSVIVEATEPKLMMSDKIIRLKLSALVDPHYLNLFNNSKVSRDYYVAHASGTSSSMKNVSREVILNLPVALPPAAEQSRIVSRVDELRRLCADLRARLTARRTCQARFAETLIEQDTSAAPLEENADDLAAAA